MKCQICGSNSCEIISTIENFTIDNNNIKMVFKYEKCHSCGESICCRESLDSYDKFMIDTINNEIKNNPESVKPIDENLMKMCEELIKDVKI